MACQSLGAFPPLLRLSSLKLLCNSALFDPWSDEKSLSLSGTPFMIRHASFTFITDIGFVDICFSVDGIGSYDAVFAMSSLEEFGERRFRMLSIDGLIQWKTAIARPRDLALIPELEMMREAEQMPERSIAEARALEDAHRDSEPPSLGAPLLSSCRRQVRRRSRSNQRDALRHIDRLYSRHRCSVPEGARLGVSGPRAM
jgi:hypothetical protein